MEKEKNVISFYHHTNIEIVRGKSIHSFPKHSHNAFCIGLVEKGEMLLDLKGEEYLLEKNDVYFIPPFTEHKISPVNKTEYGYAVLCLHNDLIEQFCNFLFYKCVYKGDKTGLKFSNLIIRFYNTDNYLQLEEDVKQYLAENIKTDCILACNTIVLSAASFIKEQVEEPFNLQKISEYTHISKYHLLRLFKTHMGVAPYQFYIQEKVKKVKQGLLKDETPVKLAYNLNFSDQSHLCNTFKRYVGLTPLQFKASYRED